MTAILYRTADVDGCKIFYGETGPAGAPNLLLLHGFPSASHMFRDLIPLLADRFHLVAPDLPGFGNSDLPGRGHSFDRIATTIDRFTEIIGLTQYAVYVFDYGAPTGFRLAVKHPDRITAIISQNGNAYEEGLSDGWNPIRAYWQDPSEDNREALRAFLKPEATLWQYTHGVADSTMISPDGYSLDNFYLARTGAAEVAYVTGINMRILRVVPVAMDAAHQIRVHAGGGRYQGLRAATGANARSSSSRALPDLPELFSDPSAALPRSMGQE
jgi:pimeloyl-ACP methyl ester carboxylesterase